MTLGKEGAALCSAHVQFTVSSLLRLQPLSSGDLVQDRERERTFVHFWVLWNLAERQGVETGLQWVGSKISPNASELGPLMF